MTFLWILITLVLIGSLFAFLFRGLFSDDMHPMTESQKKKDSYFGWYALVGLGLILYLVIFNGDSYR